MRPVILVKLPNSATFVGTFDVENWRDWWKSEPLPGSVAKITDTDWAYGQYHVAICHMTNGTWSIYRSGDYGKTWYEVWNTPVTLHGIIQIDPGWLLCSASDGWYESINSGLEWNKISSQAPNCPIVVNLGDDVLMAHDGLNVWKSVNKGRNWALKINARSYTVYAYHNGKRRTGGWSGDSYPALDGCGNQVIIGIGPYLFVSDNAGETWNESWWYYDGASELFPQILPYTDKRVLQVLLTDVSGSGPEDTAYMVRIYHKAAGIVRHYYMNRPYIGMSARFDQPFSGYTDGKLTAYQVLHPGASYYDQVVFSSQMARNTDTNTYYPSVKYSADGGWTWVDLNINDFKVFEGDPSQGVFSQGGPFIEDFLTKYSWSGDPCHNSGKYSQISSGWVRMLSWDMDFLAKGFGDKTFSSDMISSIRVTQSLPFDLRMSKNLINRAYLILLHEKK